MMVAGGGGGYGKEEGKAGEEKIVENKVDPQPGGSTTLNMYNSKCRL
jgi:hypothetical protein